MKKFEGYEAMFREMGAAVNSSGDYMLDADYGYDEGTFCTVRVRRTSNAYESKVPEIYIQDGSFGRRTFAALIQTTSYGSVNTDVIDEIVEKLTQAKYIASTLEFIASQYGVEIAPHTENRN